MGFGDRPSTYTVAYILQSSQTVGSWVKFILDESQGFTDIGIERINDDVYAILEAQAQAKTGILVPGTVLAAKREFLNILDASIDSPVDLQSSRGTKTLYNTLACS